MKIELCNYSGFKIYPGHGKLFIRSDSKVFRFLNGKNESLFLQRIKPAKLDWTIVFRRLHKKGQAEETTKKKARRVLKTQRAVVGATLDAIKAKKNDVFKNEVRKKVAEKQEKLKAEKTEKDAKRKAEKAKKSQLPSAPKPKISKQQAKGASTKVSAKSR